MLKAQKVLDEVWEAIEALEIPERLWKSHWKAAVVGLRSVGHVLHNVDSKISDAAKQIIANHWERWKPEDDDETWFSTFINPARNDLLKEGKGMPVANFEVFGDGEYVRLSLTMDDGEDGIYLLNEAAEWLQEELDKIEEEINEAV